MAESQLIQDAKEAKVEALMELAKRASDGRRGYSQSREAPKHAVAEGLEAARGRGDKSAEAFALYALVGYRLLQGESADACQDSLREAVAMLRSLGERRHAGLLMHVLANSQLSAGCGANPAKALSIAKEAFNLFDDASNKASALIAQAKALMELSKAAEAITVASEALVLLLEVGDRAREASVSRMLASAHLLKKEFIQAEEVASAAAAQAPQDLRASLQAVAVKALLGLEKFDNAKALAVDGLEKAKSGKDRLAEASLLHSLARVELENDAQEALVKATKAMTMFLLMGDARQEADATHTAAKAHLAVKNYDSALQLSTQVVCIAGQSDDKDMEANALHTVAQARLGRGQTGEALQAARKAAEIFKILGDRVGEQLVSKVLARIKEKMPPPHRPTNAISLNHPSTPTNLLTQAKHCVIWNNACKEGAYIYYNLELLKLVDDISRSNMEIPVLVVSTGVHGRQVAQPLPGQQKDINGISVWGIVRTVRLEMPRLLISAVDLPTDADGAEIARILCDATADSGPRMEAAYAKVAGDGNELLARLGKV